MRKYTRKNSQKNTQYLLVKCIGPTKGTIVSIGIHLTGQSIIYGAWVNKKHAVNMGCKKLRCTRSNGYEIGEIEEGGAKDE